MIFYFTGSGNSLYVAEKIAHLQEEELYSIADCVKKGLFEFSLRENEKIGFIFPVYFYGLPTLVDEFVSKLILHSHDEKQPYIFAVCTCGGSSGYALNMFDKILSKKNLSLQYGYTVVMPDNYIILFNLIPGPEKMKRLLAGCDVLIEEANQAISRKEEGISPKQKGPLAHFMTLLNYPVYKKGHKTKPFYATAACTGCGLCSRICPSQVINMEDKRPQWKDGRCVQCLACIHRCPVRAIEYGKKTLKRGRYVNPNVRW